MLVLPTPPASENTASTGTREEAGAGSGSAVATGPANTPFRANQREVNRSRDACNESSVACGSGWGATSPRSAASHAGRPAVSLGSAGAHGERDCRKFSSRAGAYDG